MTEKREYDLLGKQFRHKDSIGRVTGRERYTCGQQLQGVACRKPHYVRIPVNEVV